MNTATKLYVYSLAAVLAASCGSKSKSSSPGPVSNNVQATPGPTPSPTVTPATPATPTVTPTPTATLTFAGSEIPNFHQVSSSIYRGGQPTEAAYAKLKSGGIKTVVSLISQYTIGDKDPEEQRTLATAAGLQYINVPMRGIMKPTVEQINQALQASVAPENLPVLIHCSKGEDRTGIVAAAYHVKYDKWTTAQATTDMYQHGHSKALWYWDSVLDEIK